MPIVMYGPGAAEIALPRLKCDKPGGWRPGMLDFIAEYMAVSAICGQRVGKGRVGGRVEGLP